MPSNDPVRRMAESLSRYESASVEDFQTRTEAVADLGAMLNNLVDALVENDERWPPYVSSDGVTADIVRKDANRFEIDGRLWLLGNGGRSWPEPFRAFLLLSADGSSVVRYEVMFGDARIGLEPRGGEATSPTPGHWLFVFASET